MSWTNAAVEIVDRTGARPPLSLPTTRAGRGWVYSLDYSADGTNLAYVYSDGIYLWDLKAMSLISKWPHPEFVASRLPLEFIVVQGKERLYCMDADRLTVYEDCLWSSPTGFFVDQVWPHQSDIRFSPHGERIAVCTNAGNQGKVEIWNLEMNALELEIGRETFVGSGLAFHPVEKLLAFAVGSTVQLVRFPGGKQQTELRLPKNVEVSHLEFSPNGKVLAMSCRRYSELRWRDDEPDEDRRLHVELWDWEWNTQVFRLENCEGRVVFSPDGTELGVCSSGLEFWTLPSREGTSSDPAPFEPI